MTAIGRIDARTAVPIGALVAACALFLQAASWWRAEAKSFEQKYVTKETFQSEIKAIGEKIDRMREVMDLRFQILETKLNRREENGAEQ